MNNGRYLLIKDLHLYTIDRVLDHVKGKRRVIPYVLNSKALLKWVCLDIDDRDFQKALNLFTTMQGYGVDALIELTKSDGFHVWIILMDWFDGEIARDFLKIVVAENGNQR